MSRRCVCGRIEDPRLSSSFLERNFNLCVGCYIVAYEQHELETTMEIYGVDFHGSALPDSDGRREKEQAPKKTVDNARRRRYCSLIADETGCVA